MKKYIGLFIAVLLILLALPVYAQTIQVTLQQCSTAAHNSYKAQGPNGSMYPTWHPQIDFTNGCFHGHEHGSNPLNIDMLLYLLYHQYVFLCSV